MGISMALHDGKSLELEDNFVDFIDAFQHQCTHDQPPSNLYVLLHGLPRHRF